VIAAALAGLALLVLDGPKEATVAVVGGPGSPADAGSLVLLLHLGLVVSVLAYGLYFAAAKVLAPTHVVILTLLEPLTAAAPAVLLLDQTLTVSAVAGGILLLGAVVALRGAAPPPAPGLEAGTGAATMDGARRALSP
jgi:drug/metabolite transporter (DMT)-like permease